MKVRALPDMALLPAHGPVAVSSHDRVDELLTHHEERLQQCVEAVAQGASTAWEAAALILGPGATAPVMSWAPSTR